MEGTGVGKSKINFLKIYLTCIKKATKPERGGDKGIFFFFFFFFYRRNSWYECSCVFLGQEDPSVLFPHNEEATFMEYLSLICVCVYIYIYIYIFQFYIKIKFKKILSDNSLVNFHITFRKKIIFFFFFFFKGVKYNACPPNSVK